MAECNQAHWLGLANSQQAGLLLSGHRQGRHGPAGQGTVAMERTRSYSPERTQALDGLGGVRSCLHIRQADEAGRVLDQVILLQMMIFEIQ